MVIVGAALVGRPRRDRLQPSRGAPTGAFYEIFSSNKSQLSRNVFFRL